MIILLLTVIYLKNKSNQNPIIQLNTVLIFKQTSMASIVNSVANSLKQAMLKHLSLHLKLS